MDGCVKLIEEEGESLLALQSCSREQVTVAQAEFHLGKNRGFQSIQETQSSTYRLDVNKKSLFKKKKIYLYINPICFSPLNEGCPKPVVNIWVADVTDNIAPPIDPLVKVCEAFLNPACDK